jgi:putative FmdB family regulatory protein
MPTYTYRCTSCAESFERWQKMTDEPLQACPQCQGQLRRVPAPVGLMFKGAGFYCTDTRTKDPQPTTAGSAT